MKPDLIIAFVIAAFAVASCDSKQPGSAAEPGTDVASSSSTSALSETSAVDASDAPADVETDEAPVLRVEHHPFPMEHHRLKLTVADGGEFVFRTAPEKDADIAKKIVLDDGELFEFDRSRTVIAEPLELLSRVSVRVDGTPLDGGDLVIRELAAGQPFRAYLYAGEGLCYIELNGELMVGTCPDLERFQADDWDGKSPMPDSMEWWVQSRHGWHLVDLERFDREQISTL